MKRNTLISLVAFAVLGIGAIVVFQRPEKGERESDRPRPVAKVDPATFDTLEITKAGAKTVLTRAAGKFGVTAPVAYPADEANAKAAFEAIEKLQLRELVTDQKSKQAEFEVDDAKAVHVVAKAGKQGGKVLVDLLFGKATGSGTMVRPAGKDEIWTVAGSLRYTFEKTPADWRDRGVTTFTPGDAEKIDVKAKDGATIALAKKPAEAGKESAPGAEAAWDVKESSVKIDKLDPGVPNGIVSALASFKTNEFADGAKPEETGLAAPALTVAVGLKGGKTVTLLVGNKKGEDEFYAKVAESPQVFLVKKYNIERINKRPMEFRDKTLCDIPESDLGELAVTNGDKSYTVAKTAGAWKATKPAKLEVEASKVTPIASAFKEWKATSFAEDADPKSSGLAKPKMILAKAAKGGATCAIKVGDESKDKQSYYVQNGKSPEVYLVPKWSADRILVKPDDLKKGSAPAPAAGGMPPGMPGHGMPGGMPPGMMNPHANN